MCTCEYVRGSCAATTALRTALQTRRSRRNVINTHSLLLQLLPSTSQMSSCSRVYFCPSASIRARRGATFSPISVTKV